MAMLAYFLLQEGTPYMYCVTYIATYHNVFESSSALCKVMPRRGHNQNATTAINSIRNVGEGCSQ